MSGCCCYVAITNLKNKTLSLSSDFKKSEMNSPTLTPS